MTNERYCDPDGGANCTPSTKYLAALYQWLRENTGAEHALAREYAVSFLSMVAEGPLQELIITTCNGAVDDLHSENTTSTLRSCA